MNEDNVIAFTVYGRAEPAGSKRIVPAGGRAGGHPIVTDDNPRSKDWQRRVAAVAGAEMHGRELLDSSLRLTIRFVIPRLGSHLNSKGEPNAEGLRHPYPDKRPDLTKLVRGVEDALTGVVWRDDARVVQQELTKVWGEPARIEVEVEPALPFDRTRGTRR